MKKIIFISSLLFVFACKDKETPKPNSPDPDQTIKGDWKIVKSDSDRHLTIFPQVGCENPDVNFHCMEYLSISDSIIKKTISYADTDNTYEYSYSLNNDTIIVNSRIFQAGSTFRFKGDTLIIKTPNFWVNKVQTDHYSYYIRK